jgi:hypothetical protein
MTATIIPLPRRKPPRLGDVAGLSLAHLHELIEYQQGLLSSPDLDTVRNAGRKLDVLRAEIDIRRAAPRSIDDLWPAGFWSGLSDDQRRAALDYRGDETIGVPTSQPHPRVWPATGEREDET